MRRKAFLVAFLVVLSIAGSLLVINSGRFSVFIARVVSSRLQARFGGTFDLKSVEFKPFERRVVLKSFEYSGKNYEFERVAFKKLSVRFQMAPIFAGKVYIEDVFVSEPEIAFVEKKIKREKKKSFKIPFLHKWKRGWLDLRVSKLSLDRLTMTFYYPTAGVMSRLMFNKVLTYKDRDMFKGVLAGTGDILFPSGLEKVDRILSEVEFKGGYLDIRKFDLSGNGFWLKLEGLVWPSLDMAFSTHVIPSFLERISKGSVKPAGDIDLSGEISGELGGSSLSGEVDGIDLTVAGVGVRSLGFKYAVGVDGINLYGGRFKSGPLNGRFSVSVNNDFNKSAVIRIDGAVPDMSVLADLADDGQMFLKGGINCSLSTEGSLKKLKGNALLKCFVRDGKVGGNNSYALVNDLTLACSASIEGKPYSVHLNKCNIKNNNVDFNISGKINALGIKALLKGSLKNLLIEGKNQGEIKESSLSASFENYKTKFILDINGMSYKGMDINFVHTIGRISKDAIWLDDFSGTLENGYFKGGGIFSWKYPEKSDFFLNARGLSINGVLAVLGGATPLGLKNGILECNTHFKGKELTSDFNLHSLDWGLSGIKRAEGRLSFDIEESVLDVATLDLIGSTDTLHFSGGVDLNTKKIWSKVSTEKFDFSDLSPFVPTVDDGCILSADLDGAWEGGGLNVKGNLSLKDKAGGLTALLEFYPKENNTKVDISLLEGTAEGTLLLLPYRPYLKSGKLYLKDFDPFKILLTPKNGRRYISAGLYGRLTFYNKDEVKRRWLDRVDVIASLDRIELFLKRFSLVSAEKSEFYIKDGKFAITPLVLKGENSHLSITQEDRDGVRISGMLDLGYLDDLLEDVTRADGDVGINMLVRGLPLSPLVEANAEVHSGTIAVKGVPLLFREIEAKAFWDGKKLNFRDVTGTAGGGHLKGKGFIDHSTKRILYDLSVTYRDVSMKLSEEMRTTSSGEVYLRGREPVLDMGGDVEIKKLIYSEKFDWRTSLGGLFLSTSIMPQGLSSEDEIVFNLNFHLKGEKGDIRIRNNILDVAVKGDVYVVGTDLNPVLNGNISLIRGEAWFQEHRFDVASASAQFVGKDENRIIYTLAAESHVKEYKIFLTVSGVNNDVKVDLSSEPPLTDTEIVALLTFGIPSESAGEMDYQVSEMGRNIAISVATGGLQQMVEKQSRKIGLIDTFQIVPSFSEDTRTSGLRMIIGKDLMPGVELMYATDMDNLGGGQEVRLRNKVNDHFSILGSIKDSEEEASDETDIGIDFEVHFEF